MADKNISFKNFEILEHKADDNGNLVITGLGAAFDNIDSYNDVIQKGAFAKTLVDRKGRIAFAYQHDLRQPIGKILDAKETDGGLWLEVMISASEKGIQTKVKEGILNEMSIGYVTINSRNETRGEVEVKILTEVKLYEVSLVTVAANPLAVVETMKSEEKQDYLKDQFDRVILLSNDRALKHELRILKALCTPEPISLDIDEVTLEIEEPSASKSDIYKSLNLE